MTQQEWENASGEERIAEIKKCYDEPWYHFNTYCRPVGGIEYTRETWEGIMGFIQTGGRRRRRFDPVVLNSKIEWKTPPENKSPYDGSAMRFRYDTDPDMPWQTPLRLAIDNPELYQKLMDEQNQQLEMWRKAFPLNIEPKGKIQFYSSFENEQRLAFEELWKANSTFGYEKEIEFSTEDEAKNFFETLKKTQKTFFSPAWKNVNEKQEESQWLKEYRAKWGFKLRYR